MTDWARYAYESWLFPEMGEGRPIKHPTQVATVIGQFCEQYLCKLLRGEKDRSLLEIGIEPDLIFRMDGMVDYDIVMEIKGMGRRYGVHISHDQVLRYTGLTANEFPLTSPRVFYAFCVHNLTRMSKNYDTDVELLNDLCHNYLGTLILPLEVIHALLSWLPRKPNHSWDTPCHEHDWLTNIMGPPIHKMILGDNDIIEWLTKKFNDADDPKRAMPLPDWRHYEVIRWRTPQVFLHGFAIHESWMTAMLPVSNNAPRASDLVYEYQAVCNACGSVQSVYTYKGHKPPKAQTLECLNCDCETLHITRENK